ncbi:MAG TPA: MFS transporter [Spirochaetia bacterium]
MPLITLFITLVAFAVSANAVSPLLSTLAVSLGVPASSFGFFITLQYGAFSLASFLGGLMKERLRLTNHHLIAGGLLLIAVGMFTGALVLRSAAAMVVWIIPLGLAGGATETFASVEISALGSAASSRNLCLSQVFYTIGAFAAPQIVSLIFGAGMRYTAAFVIFGAFSTAVLVFFLVSAARRGGFSPAGATRETRPAPLPLRGPLVALLPLLMLACVLTESLSAAWLPYVFEKRFSLLPRDASLVLVTFWVGMMAGRLIVVALPARWTLWPTLVGSSLGVLVSGAFLVGTAGLPAQWIGVALLGVSLGPAWPVIVMTASSAFHSDRLTSIIIGVGAAGSAVGPLIGSLIVSQGWMGRYFAFHLALGVALTLLSVMGWRARRAKTEA